MPASANAPRVRSRRRPATTRRADVQDESPKDTLRDGERQRNQNQGRKRRHADLEPIEVDASNGLEHRDANHDQDAGRGVRRDCGDQRRDEQAGQEADRCHDRGAGRCGRPSGSRRRFRHTPFRANCQRVPRSRLPSSRRSARAADSTDGRRRRRDWRRWRRR